MAKKSKKPRFKWHKFGDWSVYEGNDFVVVGNTKGGYSVHSKDLVDIMKKDIKYKHWGYYGTYPTRKEAVELLNALDSAQEEGGTNLISISGDPQFVDKGAHVAYIPKTKTHIIAYPEERPKDVVHELVHVEKGHLKDQKGYRWDREVEATKCEMHELKRMGKYTPEVRQGMIESLATYGGRTKKGSIGTRMEKARATIRKLEKSKVPEKSKLPRWLPKWLKAKEAELVGGT